MAATLEAQKRRSLADWKRRGVYDVTLPSGMEVSIRYPDLMMMATSDAMPERLRALAVKQARGDTLADDAPPSPEQEEERSREELKMLEEMREFLHHLVVAMVTEPELSYEDVADLPPEDRDMLIAIAQRERDTDAKGRLLGVVPLNAFDRFRVRHSCTPDCPSCEKVRDDFSLLDVR
jgi:hypothetical protein